MIDKKTDKTFRGAVSNKRNPFLKNKLVTEFPEGLDEPLDETNRITKIHMEYPREVVNKVDSPDIPMGYSLNPYQGCEHGCIYCYARNTHTYWGFSAGLDFEQQIMAKPDAPKLLRNFLSKKNYLPQPISLSGNTDCYQPTESKMRITRQILEVLLEFKNPVGIITKNSLVLRDLDILKPMAEMGLVCVFVSITTLDDELRRIMEPRTSTIRNRLKTIQVLTENGIPVGVMVAPVIPGLTLHEMPNIMKAAAENGAVSAGYTMVRLNGQIGELFTDWLDANYPLKKNKILNQISQAHGGQLNDSRWGTRMKGEGPVADIASQMFKQAREKYFGDKHLSPLNISHFKQPHDSKGQAKLF